MAATLPTALTSKIGEGGTGFQGQVAGTVYKFLTDFRSWAASASAQLDTIDTSIADLVSSVDTLQALTTNLSVSSIQTDIAANSAEISSINTWITTANKGINEKYYAVDTGPTSGASVAVTSLESTDSLTFVFGVKHSTASIAIRTSDVAITSAGNLTATTDLSAEGLVVIFRKG
jgi:hypothetical protein